MSDADTADPTMDGCPAPLGPGDQVLLETLGHATGDRGDATELVTHWLSGALPCARAWVDEPNHLHPVLSQAWQETPGADVLCLNLSASTEGRARALGSWASAAIGDRSEHGTLNAWSPASRAWTSADRKRMRFAAACLARALDAGQIAHPTTPEQRAIESLRAEKSAVLRLLAHELRTPLTSILGGIDLMSAHTLGNQSEQALAMLERMSRAADRLLDITRNATALLSTVGIADVVDPRHVLDAQAIELAIQRAARTVADRDVALQLGPIPEHLYVAIPTEELHEILERLLANAAKFSPLGSEITLGVWAAASDDHVEFVIDDTGCGIPTPDLTTLGEPFTKSRLSITEEHQGLGLGLAAAQRIARAWGGEISLQSVETGSTVILSLPGGRRGAAEE